MVFFGSNAMKFHGRMMRIAWSGREISDKLDSHLTPTSFMTELVSWIDLLPLRPINFNIALSLNFIVASKSSTFK